MALCNYQVFLSYRGPETFSNLAKFIHDRLTSAGITTFLDREEILSGQDISNKLIDAIRGSDVCVPIFSPDFASSGACLTEVAKMVELGKEIRPIFFFVKPCDVRHQLGTYATSFAEHCRKKHYPESTIQKWREALTKIADIRGLELKNAALQAIVEAARKKIGVGKGREITKADLVAALAETGGQFDKDLMDGFREVDVFISHILKLSRRMVDQDVTSAFEFLGTSVATIEHVIGIDDRMKEVIKLLDIEDDEVGVRIVGIHGTNGIGKTTIAKAVYDRLSSYFGGCSFLAEIGETARNGGGIQFVQSKLISDILKRNVDVASFEEGIDFFLDVFRSIKVLIVLDDVDKQSHLDNLVGSQLDWFGSGSRIIVTTENREILQNYYSLVVDTPVESDTYELKEMDKHFAIELFCKHALGTHGSKPGYPEIGERIVKATGQVPLVIEVIGSLLRGKKEQEWMDMEGLIKPREENSQKECWEILEICYEALHDKQKEIFWDIAWFANGVDSRIASYMWPDGDLLCCHVLMPLAKIGEDNILRMHKLLKSLGKTIDQKDTKDPGRRSGQYMHVTDLEEFNKKEGKEEVEALCFDLKTHPRTFNETDFESMPNIRFLNLDHASMTGDFANVFQQLRWLRWQGCPGDFEAAEFSLTVLVILDLSWSKVTDEWGGWRLMKMEQLKVLNLTGCTDLLISPKFSSFPNLEILILERCSRLVYFDPSVGDLKNLFCLNLKSCTELNRLPAELGRLEALKELLIDGTSVEEIPLKGYSKELETLSASNCMSLSLPVGVGEMVKLRRLSLRNCHWIEELPESIGQSPLEELDISGTGISKLPDSFGNLQRLRVLKMDDCFIRKFPSFIWDLQSLEEIHASSCGNLEEGIPGDIGNLKNLRILRLRSSAIASLPLAITCLPKLEILDVLHCDMLHELPELPSSLVIVHLSPNLKEKVSPLSKEHCFITV